MRLTSFQIQTFIDVFSPLLVSNDGELYLYGSRANDLLKGGDIDLLLLVRSPQKAADLTKIRADILNKIKKVIGEVRIDLSIVSDAHSIKDPFYKSVISTAVLLKKF